MHNLSEPLPELFTKSKIIYLDFSEIPAGTAKEENIQLFFKNMAAKGLNPRLPENRQAFNDQMMSKSNSRYLIGRYGENREAMLHNTPAGKEGRTYHMGIDIFSKGLEPITAPCAGEIVASGYEDGFGEYGNYLTLKPVSSDYYLFFGHLSTDKVGIGPVGSGQLLAHLGDYVGNENGGWSRHLHLQVLTRLPSPNKTPDGYSSHEDLEKNKQLFPNPIQYFPELKLAQ